MEVVEPTFRRSLKVWWSFAWRCIALMFAIVFPLELLCFGLIFAAGLFPRPGAQMDPEQMRRFLVIFPLLWVAVVSLMIVVQTLGMRWMLRRAQWSDFRVVLVPKSQP